MRFVKNSIQLWTENIIHLENFSYGFSKYDWNTNKLKSGVYPFKVSKRFHNWMHRRFKSLKVMILLKTIL
jgi:hypothetical protein